MNGIKSSGRGISLCAIVAAICWAQAPQPAGPSNPFYAMDTCTKRPYPQNDITPAQQFDMLKELGYAGIAWTEEPAEQVKSAVLEAEARGLKMFAIYCGASVTPAGELKPSPLIEPIMEALEGRDTLIWLHIGGDGPKIDSLTGREPVIGQLSSLARAAEQHGLKIALYPHVSDWTEHFHDALRVARLVGRRNLGVTFNLCHSLAVGDEGRIPALLEEAGPLLFTATLNGADTGVKGPRWDRLIQAIDRGTYDLAVVLRTLRRLGFQGPIGLQGYGLGGDRRENLARSIEAWRKLLADK
jgi:sugar phosphate isomerase/epimerase